jgi:hypothetical protein
MSTRNIARVVGVLIWATLFMLYLTTHDQLFIVLATMAIIGQVLTSVMLAGR